MVVLGIDTATTRASVGLQVAGEARAERCIETRSHAVALIPLLESLLTASALSLREIDAIGVALGPGSFTGLRVGLSTAKGLAYATGARLIGVSTLEALAFSVRGHEGFVVPMLDARKEEVYTAQFRVGAGSAYERLTPDTLCPLEEALASLPGRAVIVGDAECAYGETIRKRPGVAVRSFATHGPSGLAVAALAARRLAAEPDADAMDLEPAYLRPSEAELKAVSR